MSWGATFTPSPGDPVTHQVGHVEVIGLQSPDEAVRSVHQGETGRQRYTAQQALQPVNVHPVNPGRVSPDEVEPVAAHDRGNGFLPLDSGDLEWPEVSTFGTEPNTSAGGPSSSPKASSGVAVHAPPSDQSGLPEFGTRTTPSGNVSTVQPSVTATLPVPQPASSAERTIMYADIGDRATHP